MKKKVLALGFLVAMVLLAVGTSTQAFEARVQDPGIISQGSAWTTSVSNTRTRFSSLHPTHQHRPVAWIDGLRIPATNWRARNVTNSFEVNHSSHEWRIATFETR